MIDRRRLRDCNRMRKHGCVLSIVLVFVVAIAVELVPPMPNFPGCQNFRSTDDVPHRKMTFDLAEMSHATGMQSMLPLRDREGSLSTLFCALDITGSTAPSVPGV